MTETTHPIIEQFVSDGERLTATVIAGGDWTGSSPCEGWTAADVLDHLIDTERDFLSQRGVDLGERPEGEPAERWSAHWTALRAALSAELMDQEFAGALGTMTVGPTLSTFYGLDLLVHRWDLGTALGHRITFADEELDRIEAILDQLGEMIYSYGASKPALPTAPDAPSHVRVLARLGRRA